LLADSVVTFLHGGSPFKVSQPDSKESGWTAAQLSTTAGTSSQKRAKTAKRRSWLARGLVGLVRFHAVQIAVKPLAAGTDKFIAFSSLYP